MTANTNPPRVGRYQAERIYAHGSTFSAACPEFGPDLSPPNPTSEVWLGTDLETGHRVVLKAFASDRNVYQGEVNVQREMIGCPRLARMVAFDDQQMIIVKDYIDGVLTDATLIVDGARHATPAFSVPRVRAILTDIMECVAYAARVGRVGNHALGGNAAEGNVVIGPDRATAIEMCSARLGAWRGHALMEAAAQRAIWLYRWSQTPPPGLHARSPVSDGVLCES